MTHGYGIMYPYASRVEPPDRWAIAAYIRALQLSHDAKLADVPGPERARDWRHGKDDMMAPSIPLEPLSTRRACSPALQPLDG